MTTTVNEPHYEKLTRGVRRYTSAFVAPKYRLWMANDHLLHICDTGYTESYKRFYFRDIQAIVVSATQTGRNLSIFFGAMAALMGFFAVSGYVVQWQWDIGMVVLTGSCAVIFAALALRNILLGPTCRCVIYTGVHTEPIQALNRWRKTRRILHRIEAQIESVQGALSDEQLAEKRSSLPTAAAVRRTSPLSKHETNAPPRHDEGNWHALLFVMVLVGAASSAVDAFANFWLKNLLDTVWYLAIMLVSVTVVIKQAGTDLKAKLGGMAWAVLLTVMGSLFTFTMYQIGLTMEDPALARAPFSVVDPETHPFVRVYSITMCVLYALLGIIGFLLLRDFRRTHRRAQAVARAAEQPVPDSRPTAKEA